MDKPLGKPLDMQKVKQKQAGFAGTCSLVLLLVGLLIGIAQPSIAQDAPYLNIYEVSGVNVDISAETAAEAREQALADGQRQAFLILLSRMTLADDQIRLPALSDVELSEFVQDFSVAGEKTSSVRYIATLTYRFKSQEVRDLLRAFNIPFAETLSKPVVVLPVLQTKGALVLWDDPNPWRDAWEIRPETVGLVPTILPLGDLQDVATIGVEQVVQGDRQRLQAIAERYEAGSTVVAFASQRIDPATGSPVLQVTLTRYNVTSAPRTTVVAFTPLPGEDMPATMTRAASELVTFIEDLWKRENLLVSGNPDAIAVRVPIANLGDWIKVREKLSKVQIVREVELVLLSRNEVQLILHYLGDVSQIIVALEQADLVLQGAGEAWTLTPIGIQG